MKLWKVGLYCNHPVPLWRDASNWVGELRNSFGHGKRFFGVAVMLRLTPHPAVIQRLLRLRRVWSLHGNIDKVQLPGQICLLPDWTSAWKSVSIDMWRPSRPIFFSWRFCCRTDLDRRPGAIRFAAFSFDSSTTHEFRVTARYETSSLTVTWHGCLAGLLAFFESRYVFKVGKSPEVWNSGHCTWICLQPHGESSCPTSGHYRGSQQRFRCLWIQHLGAEIRLQLSAMMFWKKKCRAF